MPVLSILFALFVMGIFLTVFFMEPGRGIRFALSRTFEAYGEMLSWPFGNLYGFYETLNKMIPLAFVGLGLCIAYRMRIWNIGGEGQLYMGAFAATWGALFLFNDLQSPLLMACLVISMGAVFGAIWGLIPAVMKAFAKTDEIVVTLMLNYVAIFWVDYLVYGRWRDPAGFGFPLTAEYPAAARLPRIFDGNVQIGLVFVVVLAVFLEYVYRRTSWGQKSALIGDNIQAAIYAGVNIKLFTILALLASGAIAGAGGAVQMMGAQHRLQPGFSPGYGYTAIIIAWLGKLNPIGVVVVAILFGGLLVGNEQLQMFYRVPIALVYVFQGLVLFSLLGGEAISRYRIRFHKRGDE